MTTNENPFANLSVAELRKIISAPAAVDGMASFVYAMVVASGVVLSEEQMATAKAVATDLAGNGEASLDQFVTAWGEESDLTDFSVALKRVMEKESESQ
jgi:hypothetical protein